MGIKLSKVQEGAYNKLKRIDSWECSYTLRESLATMRALERKGLVKSRGHYKAGAFAYPQISIEFKALGGKG